MTPETLFKYCFAAVTGTGFGLLLLAVIVAILGGMSGIGGIEASIEKRDRKE